METMMYFLIGGRIDVPEFATEADKLRFAHHLVCAERYFSQKYPLPVGFQVNGIFTCPQAAFLTQRPVCFTIMMVCFWEFHRQYGFPKEEALIKRKCVDQYRQHQQAMNKFILCLIVWTWVHGFGTKFAISREFASFNSYANHPRPSFVRKFDLLRAFAEYILGHYNFDEESGYFLTIEEILSYSYYSTHQHYKVKQRVGVWSSHHMIRNDIKPIHMIFLGNWLLMDSLMTETWAKEDNKRYSCPWLRRYMTNAEKQLFWYNDHFYCTPNVMNQMDIDFASEERHDAGYNPGF
jgi:hypothetical protein